MSHKSGIFVCMWKGKRDEAVVYSNFVLIFLSPPVSAVRNSLHFTFAWCIISFAAVSNYFSMIGENNNIISLCVVTVPVNVSREKLLQSVSSRSYTTVYVPKCPHTDFSHAFSQSYSFLKDPQTFLLAVGSVPLQMYLNQSGMWFLQQRRWWMCICVITCKLRYCVQQTNL